MNLRLSDQRIRDTCREMLKHKSKITGRGLCAELRQRFGATGKTTRVFAIWREEVAPARSSIARLRQAEIHQAATIRMLRGQVIKLTRELGILRNKR